jgi:hypothetical protein
MVGANSTTTHRPRQYQGGLEILTMPSNYGSGLREFHSARWLWMAIDAFQSLLSLFFVRIAFV